jgi:DNA/RNA endonuclease YhcR with UshA esterase domain
MTCSKVVRMLAPAFLAIAALQVSAECVPFSDAHQHVGKTQCISGTVFHVKEGTQGVTFLDFCETFESCPFTVVVFPGDLKYVGDVRQLKGRAIEIKGTVQDYDGRAEIILRHPRQLGKDAALVPPLPKGYDVERRGKYSPGKFKRPKATKKTRKKQGRPVDIEDPSESQ